MAQEATAPALKISDATARNWARLHVSSAGERLKARANKTRSERLFVPTEYLADRNSLPLLEKAVAYIRLHALPAENALYSLGLNLLRGCPIGPATRQLVEDFLQKNAHPADPYLAEEFPYPREEWDFLGAVYQSLTAEGEKNACGSYFTPAVVVEAMCSGLSIGPSTRILDPCCGSGGFLRKDAEKVAFAPVAAVGRIVTDLLERKGIDGAHLAGHLKTLRLCAGLLRLLRKLERRLHDEGGQRKGGFAVQVRERGQEQGAVRPAGERQSDASGDAGSQKCEEVVERRAHVGLAAARASL